MGNSKCPGCRHDKNKKNNHNVIIEGQKNCCQICTECIKDCFIDCI